MAALDLLGRKWALRILWELQARAMGARELARACDEMSSSVLYQRLAELTEARLVVQAGDGQYELTAIGAKLGHALQPLNRWAGEWAKSLPR